MSSVADICNRALQRLGAGSISVITEDSTEAIECNRCYRSLRDAELRAYIWGFAKSRVALAASVVKPAFGPANAFPVAGDFLRLIKAKNNRDWAIENQNGIIVILTNDAAPLEVPYIKRVTNTELFDPLFDEALAARMATEMSEKLTQSTKKGEVAEAAYRTIIAQARSVNALERHPEDPVEDDWSKVRRT